MVTFYDLCLFLLKDNYNLIIGNIPMNVDTGSDCDSLPFFRFHLWKPICFNSDDISFPSESREETCIFVGVVRL